MAPFASEHAVQTDQHRPKASFLHIMLHLTPFLSFTLTNLIKLWVRTKLVVWKKQTKQPQSKLKFLKGLMRTVCLCSGSYLCQCVCCRMHAACCSGTGDEGSPWSSMTQPGPPADRASGPVFSYKGVSSEFDLRTFYTLVSWATFLKCLFHIFNNTFNWAMNSPKSSINDFCKNKSY